MNTANNTAPISLDRYNRLDATTPIASSATIQHKTHKPVRHLAYGKDFKYHVDFVQHAKIQADLKRKERNKKRQINARKGAYLLHDVV